MSLAQGKLMRNVWPLCYFLPLRYMLIESRFQHVTCNSMFDLKNYIFQFFKLLLLFYIFSGKNIDFFCLC